MKRTLKRPTSSTGGLATFLQPANRRAPRKTLIYGAGGCGKSTWANQFPRPIFWVTDPGLGTIDCRKFPRAHTYEEFVQWQDVLKSNLDDFGTLVLDSLGTLELLIWQRVCSAYKGKDGRIQKLDHINDPGFGAGYVQAMQYWEPIFQFLDELNEQHDKEIVLISHARADTSVNTETADSLKMMPAVYKHVQYRLDQWCDEIFYAYIPMIVRSEEQNGKVKFKGTKSEGQRKMACVGCGCWMAKNRLELPLEIEFDYEVYKQYVDQFYEKKGQ